jgi:hypothetical protein
MELVDDINLPNSVSIFSGSEIIRESLAQNGQKTFGKRKIAD